MGKSAAAAVLIQRGVPVVDADELARKLVAPGEPALAEIAAEFGCEVLASDGSLARSVMAKLVFADEGARRQLEAILHPRIRVLWCEQVGQWRQSGRGVGSVVVPLLFEVGAEGDFDAIVCVACSAETQRRRLAGRSWSETESARRIAAQWPVERKAAVSDYVVWSEGSLAVLEAQVDRVLAGCGL